MAALKEKLERKEGTFELSGTAALGAERIHQLHSQLKILKTNEQEMRKEMDALENDKRKLEREMKNLERERDKAVQRAEEVLGRYLAIRLFNLRFQDLGVKVFIKYSKHTSEFTKIKHYE